MYSCVTFTVSHSAMLCCVCMVIVSVKYGMERGWVGEGGEVCSTYCYHTRTCCMEPDQLQSLELVLPVIDCGFCIPQTPIPAAILPETHEDRALHSTQTKEEEKGW